MAMRFGIDLDAVVADTAAGILRRLQAELGLVMGLEDITDYYVDDWARRRPDVAAALTAMLYEEAFYEGLYPLAGAVPGVRYLASLGPCYFITARPEQFQLVTRSWLDKHDLPTDIPLFCREEKELIARELGISHFVEDSPGQTHRLVGQGIRVYLFDYPWNRHFNGEAGRHGEALAAETLARLVCRVKGWPDLVDLLNGSTVGAGHEG